MGYWASYAHIDSQRRWAPEVQPLTHSLNTPPLTHSLNTPPPQRVICLDIKPRTSFLAFVKAFKAHGVKLPGWKEPLQNLEFMEGSLESAADHEAMQLSGPETVAAGDVAKDMNGRSVGTPTGTACLLALHGCNEVNKIAIEMAQV
jgi:hypothetical protein